jgi:hypothetical protein
VRIISAPAPVRGLLDSGNAVEDGKRSIGIISIVNYWQDLNIKLSIVRTLANKSIYKNGIQKFPGELSDIMFISYV